MSKRKPERDRQIVSSGKVPKKKGTKTALARQTRHIVRLLSVWPTCPKSAIERSIKDVLGVAATRACLQKAKEILGLHDPDHSERVLAKFAYTRFIVTNLACQRGLFILPDNKFVVEARQALKNRFSESTQDTLVRTWVLETLEELRVNAPTQELLNDRIVESREELQLFGIDTPLTNQIELL